MAYTPQADGLAARVCAWFKKDPDGELSRADIAKKFDVKAASIDGLLGQCFAVGYLNRGKDDEGNQVIVAGPNLKLLNAAPPPPTTTPSQANGTPQLHNLIAARRRGGVRPRLPELSIAALKVENGVPIPPPIRKMAKGATKYDEIFGALQLNQSVVLPRVYGAAIKKAAAIRKKQHAQTFVVRVLNDTQLRLWRTE